MSQKATVRSRDGLSAKLISALRLKLRVDSIENVTDKTIAGGFLVQVGDRLYDYTLKNVLDGSEIGSSSSVGTVLAAGDGIAKVSGLSELMACEMVKFESGGFGLALNLEEKEVGVIIMGDHLGVKPGDRVVSTGEILSIPVGKDLIGRVINPLGQPLDGKSAYQSEQRNPLEKVAPGVIARKSVSEPIQTGIKAIDSMIPIGRGQRELIIGDRQTGKTSIALTTIINQKGKNATCIYVAIGQKRSNVARIIATLENYGAMEHTILVAATASDPASMQYLAPYAGSAIAEYFLQKGEDALVVYDDLTKHAWAYREISLLLRRPSGREAYPGDVFYAHSRLLERSCRLDQKFGGGSITALPIIETQAGDVSGYIPTNVISITDGQIYLLADLFNAGQRPALDVGVSVSRVGGAAQTKAIKQVAGKLKLELAQYRELAAFAQFASDLDENTQRQLNRGKKMSELLKQRWDEPMSVSEQVLVIWAATTGALDEIPVEQVNEFERALLELAKNSYPDILDEIEDKKELSEKLKEKLNEIVKLVAEIFKEKNAE